MFLRVPMEQRLIFTTPSYLIARYKFSSELIQINLFTITLNNVGSIFMSLFCSELALKGYTIHPELNPPYVFIGMCNPFYIGLRLSCEISSLEQFEPDYHPNVVSAQCVQVRYGPPVVPLSVTINCVSRLVHGVAGLVGQWPGWRWSWRQLLVIPVVFE